MRSGKGRGFEFAVSLGFGNDILILLGGSMYAWVIDLIASFFLIPFRYFVTYLGLQNACALSHEYISSLL